MKPTIVLAADHAGFELKENIKHFLSSKGYHIVDKGAHSYDEQDDYPDFIVPAAQEVARSPDNTKGIIFGGSGQGEAIAANRVKGIRAALYYGKDIDIVKLSRTHNNANILSLGARFVTSKDAQEAVMLWLSTPFDPAERHSRRIAKIDKH